MADMFSFDDATIDGGSKYLKPGIHTVGVKSITDGAASTGSTYLEITLEDKEGMTTNHRYFLNTQAGPSGKSSWDITRNAILQMVAAAYKLEAEEAKTKLPKASSPSQLAAELAKVLVGRPFDVRLNGKELPGKDGKPNWVKAEIASGKFAAPAGSNSLTFDPAKAIKMLPASDTSGIAAPKANVEW